MSTSGKHPAEWRQRVPAEVFGCLLHGELRIVLWPGLGIANGGAHWDVPVDQIPLDLRLPNTRLWLQLDEDLRITRVWPREA